MIAVLMFLVCWGDRLCSESMDILGDRFGLRLLGDRHQVWLNQSAPCFGTMYYGNRHYS